MTKIEENSKLMGQLMDSLQVKNLHLLDIGASGKLFPPFEVFLGLPEATIHLIEPSRTHAAKLRNQYSAYKNVIVHEVGLFKTSGTFQLNFSDTGGASLYNRDRSIADRYVDYHVADGPNVVCDVEVLAVDKWFEREGIPSVLIAKLDTQGCELEILKTSNDRFSKASAIYTEAPTGHKYLEQPTLSEYCSYFESNDFELFDIVNNYSSLIIGSSREAFAKQQLHLKQNFSHQNSVFKPRIMDGDLLYFKKRDAIESQQEIRRLVIAYAAMGYLLEAYDALSGVSAQDADVDGCRNALEALLKRNARYHDKYSIWRLAEKVFRRYFTNL